MTDLGDSNKSSAIGATREMNNAIIAWRKDGLCERLIAVLNGKLISDHFGLQFWFSWPDQAALRKSGYPNYVQPEGLSLDFRCLFSTKILSDHYLDDRENGMLNKKHFQLQNDANFGLTLNTDHIPKKRKSELPFWLAPRRVNSSLRRNLRFDLLPELFRHELFSCRVEKSFAEIENLTLPHKKIAIHLRSGDVVYTNNRIGYHLPRHKSLDLAVADHICNKYSQLGYKIFVAGTNKKELRYLSKTYSSVFTAKDLDLPQDNVTISVLMDVYLMSRCELLFAAQDSAVSDLASYVGSASLRTGQEILGSMEEQKVLANCIRKPGFSSFHPRQMAYIYYNLFHVSPLESFEFLDGLLVKAYTCDPLNVHYLAVRFLNALAHSEFSLAKDFENEFYDYLEHAGQLTSGGRDISCLKRFLRVKNERIKILLRTASASRNIPRKTREAFAHWAAL